MSLQVVIEINVDDDGAICADLLVDGAPVEGHGDTTGTLSVETLLDPLVRRAIARARGARAARLIAKPPDIAA